jgi:starvation-inducible DNA-binding protein
MTNTVEQLFETRIDIEPNTRQQMISILNAQLADTFDLVSLIKQAHWNVKGPQFIALHKLFDELAGSMLEYVDLIAERVTALGGTAMGTVRMAATASRLAPYPADLVQDMATVRFLADQMAALAASTRAAADQAENLRDMATNDLFIEVVRDLDKWLWFLEAHLQG